ncbi:histidinol-phosphate transaminase [Solimicrobium silvestre]|uniref:Histidinol-phosphate aminotransferase n=1 Tax=Solimicrobium silvestre TaxID=2099400 RepID=A0A2S9H2C0_9BURK|nr:histidinol-phosphate transaminase [Solimicrobium silvestre]PRC94006.1 hisC: histidinol-phosphate transaminase [Solimicrobium silvestre]
MSLIKNIIRPEILAQSSYHVPDAANMVKLDAMENPYGLPDAIKAKLGAHLSEVALNRYPIPSYRVLKQKICQQFGVPTGFDVILGNGSDELISMLSVACAKPGAKVLAPVPTFVMYAISAQLAGVEFVGVPLQADLTLDLPAMLVAIKQHRPALLYLANPNNPTGTWFDDAQIIQIIHAMAEIGLVVVDEAYQPFAPGSMMSRLPEFENLIVMRTVSKLGLAGLRLGYMSAAPALLAEIEKVRPPYNVNVLTVAALEFLLDHMSLFNEQAEQICKQRSVLISTLQKLHQIHVFPSQANFVLIRVSNSEQIFNKLLEHKILVKNVGKMHQLLVDCLRVTVSTPAENQLFMDALIATLK